MECRGKQNLLSIILLLTFIETTYSVKWGKFFPLHITTAKELMRSNFVLEKPPHNTFHMSLRSNKFYRA